MASARLGPGSRAHAATRRIVEVQEEGRQAMEMLELLTKQLVLRRTTEVVKNFLPPKTVNVVFCRDSLLSK